MLGFTPRTIDSRAKANELWKEIKHTDFKIAAFDTETDGLNIKVCMPFLFQFGYIYNETIYSYVIDLDYNPVLGKQVIQEWHKIVEKAEVYLGHNIKYDLHMLHNFGTPYTGDNLSDTQFYIRFAHDSLTVAKGGPPLGLKDYCARYLDRGAKYHEKILAEERTKYSTMYNKLLLTRLKEAGLKINKITLDKQLGDCIATPEDLGEKGYRAYLDWLDLDVPVWLRDKINGTCKSEDIPYTQLDRAKVIEYAHYDIYYTLSIYHKLAPIVSARHNETALAIENSMIIPYYEMERVGFTVDKEYLSSSAVRLKNYIIIQRKNLADIIGDIRANQHEALKKFFNDNYGIVLESTGSEKLSQALPKIENEEAKKAIKLIMELRTLEKWYGVYIVRFKKQLKKINTLHTQINQVGAVTTRISSDLQQFPKKGILSDTEELLFQPRIMVTVPEGYEALVFIDYSQIELRLQALYTILVGEPDLNMCRAYMPYQCVHKDLGLFDYNNPEHIKRWNEEWYLKEDTNTHWVPTDLHGKMTETATGLKPGDEGFKSFRSTIGKRANFAKNYGASRKRIREMFPDLSEEMITSIDEAYYKAFPGVKAYHNYCYDLASTYSFAENMFGVKFYNMSGHNLCNALVQGSGASLLKLKTREIYDYMKKEGMKSKLVLPIHDELMWIKHKDDTKEQFSQIKKIMETWNDTLVPIVAEASISYTNWAEKEDWDI